MPRWETISITNADSHLIFSASDWVIRSYLFHTGLAAFAILFLLQHRHMCMRGRVMKLQESLIEGRVRWSDLVFQGRIISHTASPPPQSSPVWASHVLANTIQLIVSLSFVLSLPLSNLRIPIWLWIVQETGWSQKTKLWLCWPIRVLHTNITAKSRTGLDHQKVRKWQHHPTAAPWRGSFPSSARQICSCASFRRAADGANYPGTLNQL